MCCDRGVKKWNLLHSVCIFLIIMQMSGSNVHTLRTVNGVSLIDNLKDITTSKVWSITIFPSGYFYRNIHQAKCHWRSALYMIPFMILIFSFYSEECSNKAGTNAGSCASGFGVCCTCKWLGGIQQLRGHNLAIFSPPPSSPCACSYWMVHCKTNTERWLFVGLEFQLYL